MFRKVRPGFTQIQRRKKAVRPPEILKSPRTLEYKRCDYDLVNTQCKPQCDSGATPACENAGRGYLGSLGYMRLSQQLKTGVLVVFLVSWKSMSHQSSGPLGYGIMLRSRIDKHGKVEKEYGGPQRPKKTMWKSFKSASGPVRCLCMPPVGISVYQISVLHRFLKQSSQLFSLFINLQAEIRRKH